VSKVDITMTAAEVEAFLARCPQVVVGAIGPDGWPTGTLAASHVADGGLVVEFGAGEVLHGDVCCVADEHASYFEIRGVIVHGRATPIDGAEARAGVAIERTVSFDFARLRPDRPPPPDRRRGRSTEVVEAAVDHQGGAGDVRAVRAGEVHDAAPDVALGVSPVTERDA
jgi:hypothetical protein